MPDRHASFAAERDDGDDAPLEQPIRRWQVLLPLPLHGAYDYLAPEGWQIARGSFVTVPLGSRILAGVVWAEGRADGVTAERLKPIDGVLDVPPMAEPLRRFVDWVAAYTLTPPGAVLRMTMSVSEALLPPRPLPACAIADSGLAALKEEEPGK